jgi:dCTP deaminase
MCVLADVDIRREIAEGRIIVDPIFDDSIRENGIDFRIGETENTNGLFVLAVTRERIRLPDNIIGTCNIRSTWARRGFFVPPTIIDAGFDGELTIELARLDLNQQWVQKGERFLHVVLFYTHTPVEKPYAGKYQYQTGITPARP